MPATGTIVCRLTTNMEGTIAFHTQSLARTCATYFIMLVRSEFFDVIFLSYWNTLKEDDIDNRDFTLDILCSKC